MEPSGNETREARPRHLNLRTRPRDYLVDERDFWPDGDLESGAPPEAVTAQRIARRYRDACADRGGLSTHKVAAMADKAAKAAKSGKADEAGKVSQTAVYNLLHGRSWLDLPTIACIERTLGVRLWVHQPPPLQARPRDYLSGGGWPDGPLVADAPWEAVLAQRVSQRLRGVCADEGLNIAEAADKSTVSPTAARDVLEGDTWPDLPTVARIEQALGVTLWARQPPALRARPRDYLRNANASWVSGYLIGGAPPEAELAQELSKRFHARCDQKRYDVAQAATEARISPTAVRDVLEGTAWLDSVTIARIEGCLGLRLWAGQFNMGNKYNKT